MALFRPRCCCRSEAHWILETLDDDPDSAKQLVYSYIQVLLYVRNIGAEPLLTFVEKPDAWCEDHFAPLVEELGFRSTDEYRSYIDELTKKFEREAKITFRTQGDYQSYIVDYPEYLEQPSGWARRLTDHSPPIDKKRVAKGVVTHYSGLLVSDIATALNMKLPLGSTGRFHERILRSTPRDIAEADVAFQLDLPVLRGVDPEILLKVRADERESFLAFRASLKSAIHERLNAADERIPIEVAQEIRSDIVEPSLNEIARKLKAARSILAKKVTVGAGIGALTTICGLLTTNPLMVTTGVGAAMTTIPAVQKYIEERRDVSLSDMYFLWRAEEVAKEIA